MTFICVLYEIPTKLTIRVGWKSMGFTEYETATQPRNLHTILAKNLCYKQMVQYITTAVFAKPEAA